jgi:type IV pilus assembly protein PilV
MRKENGFTLLEILVTLSIVSIALLGIAGITANSLKDNQSASSRSQAVLLAGDIIDRMRANRITADGGAVSPYTSPYNLALGASPSGGGIPQADLTEWRDALAAAFPAGTGSVNLDAATKKVTIVVQWDDSRGAGGLSAQQASIETRL